MGRCIVEIEIIFFDVFAVIAFTIGQAEVPLLQNGVDAVPQGECKAQALPIVRDAGDAVFAPAIGARARLIMAEIIPGGTVFAIIFAHSTPLAITQIRAPFAPDWRVAGRVVPALRFYGHRRLSP